MSERHREPEVPEEKVPVVECLDGPARITSKELAPIHSVKNGTLQNACSTRPRVVADLEKSALMRIARLTNSPAKGQKRMVDKSAVAMLKNTRQLGCVFQDMEPPKLSSILRKSSDMQKPIQRVKFTKAMARHTKIRDQNPSLGYICPGEPHQRSPNAPKFEDRSQEETEWQEQGAREAAWKLAKSVSNIKEKNKATFFSPSENGCLPASTLKPEEREFVVDSGASMHMISKKDMTDAEMDTLTKSCSPTIVITANGEVQTHEEEATVYVKELDIFLAMKVLENTPAVFSLGKLCDENGSSYEWINGQKPHLILNGIWIQCNTENFVPIVVPGLSSSSSGSSSTQIEDDRMKRVELRFLFVKDFCNREKLTLCKFPGTENPADLGTKVLDVNTHRCLCSIPLVWGLRSRQWRRSRVTREMRRSLVALGCRTCGNGLRTLFLGPAKMDAGELDVHEFSRNTDLMHKWRGLTNS